jgi:hypothetical protein
MDKVKNCEEFLVKAKYGKIESEMQHYLGKENE